MTPEDPHAVLMAVSHALTDKQQAAICAEAARRWPKMRGAFAVDILDITTDNDYFVGQTDPFFERFGEHIPDGLNFAPLVAAYAFILLGEDLSIARIMALLQKAGITGTPRYSEVEAGVLLPNGHTANVLLIVQRAEQGMRAAGVSEEVLTEFRDALRRTGTPGYARNVGDIAAWVTLVDSCTSLPSRLYDPVHDLAVVVIAADLGCLPSDGGEVAQALASLRSHLDLSSTEAAENMLRGLIEKGPRS